MAGPKKTEQNPVCHCDNAGSKGSYRLNDLECALLDQRTRTAFVKFLEDRHNFDLANKIKEPNVSVDTLKNLSGLQSKFEEFKKKIKETKHHILANFKFLGSKI